MKLYDQRIIQRGAVQSYEGHVNSHTRMQLGVDPSERFFMSGEYHYCACHLFWQVLSFEFLLYIFLLGGEDCNLRIWSIKSGELLFEDKFSKTVPSTVCWRNAERTLYFSCALILIIIFSILLTFSFLLLRRV